MIGKVTRGTDVKRLLHYLYGPGRHNEHTNPHLIAGFRLPAALEPGSRRELNRLSDVLTAPMDTLRHAPLDQPIWQCSIRAAPGDRLLEDAEWAEVAEEVVHQTGFAPRGDDRACRWIAVRHADDHIHIAVVLAREDGRNPAVYRDYLKVRDACRKVEARFGLTATAPADKTTAPRPTRAETERAHRRGVAEPPRVLLRREVMTAAIAATDEQVFFATLRERGLLLRLRFSARAPGEVTGYAVAVPGDCNQSGEPVWFSGGKLAPELTLPKLRPRWGGGILGPRTNRSAEGAQEAPRTPTASPREAIHSAYGLAVRTAVLAEQEMRWNGDPLHRADLAAAASDMLHVTAAITGHRQLTRAAGACSRAVREPHGHPPPRTRLGAALRMAGRALLVTCLGRPDQGGRTGSELSMLLSLLAGLLDIFAGHRQAQRRDAQAEAARRAAARIRAAAEPEQSVLVGHVVDARAVEVARLMAAERPINQTPPLAEPRDQWRPPRPSPAPRRGHYR
ncbi:relaxase/mobilization nuclease domain-containing protein [Actinomadura harenae]|uniref:Mobilization protein n=1 Tax=Actinomadura harenae TaxID=2483351 RepID=A0A3M2MED9_9ACTN|nr:mobilization protein [Actinomadura harenae]RMI47806.1 mobilization protein [Actinomadura harenae]